MGDHSTSGWLQEGRETEQQGGATSAKQVNSCYSLLFIDIELAVFEHCVIWAFPPSKHIMIQMQELIDPEDPNKSPSFSLSESRYLCKWHCIAVFFLLTVNCIIAHSRRRLVTINFSLLLTALTALLQRCRLLTVTVWSSFSFVVCC